MANSKSAAKRSRQTAKRSLRNRSILTQLRNLKKRTRSSKDIDRTQAQTLISAIDKAAKRGIIHRNAANRSKAKLARSLAAASR
jgi:small subunit ribosomal protein S20